jgi:cell wall-associated NlpC family hydrolase
MTPPLDRRLHVVRADLADIRLEGRVAADRFVTGTPATIGVPLADLRPAPDAARGIDTQLLFGEPVSVFEWRDGWAWVQAEEDGYVGYLPEEQLAPVMQATHWISVPRSFVYPQAELRKVPLHVLSMGSRVTVTGEAETRGTRYLLLAGGGAIIARHAIPMGEVLAADYVTIASEFLHTPYLWGGRSGFGIDCSGLVQLAMMMAGQKAPRDSDMQGQFGTAIERHELVRGDLVFWKGHVGIMEDAETLLHANGHTMTVARENLGSAIERIGWLYEQPTGYRRPG